VKDPPFPGWRGCSVAAHFHLAIVEVGGSRFILGVFLSFAQLPVHRGEPLSLQRGHQFVLRPGLLIVVVEIFGPHPGAAEVSATPLVFLGEDLPSCGPPYRQPAADSEGARWGGEPAAALYAQFVEVVNVDESAAR
jgi:hypothetical protein